MSLPIQRDEQPPYISNFISSDSSGKVPVTQFKNAEPIYLFWDSNGAYFNLYKKNETTVIYEGSDMQCIVNGIVSDTTFILEASMSRGVGPYMHASLLITYTGGDRQLSGLSIIGAEHISGSLTVDGNFSTENLDVQGNLTFGDFEANNLTVNGTYQSANDTTAANFQTTSTRKLQVTNQLEVDGPQVLMKGDIVARTALDVQTSLIVNTKVTCKDIKFTGNLNLQNVPLRLLSGGQQLNLAGKTITVKTDGFALISLDIELPAGQTSAYQYSIKAGIYYKGAWNYLTSDAVFYYSTNTYKKESLCIPIMAGESWSYSLDYNGVGNFLKAFWIPFGTNQPVADLVSDEALPEDVLRSFKSQSNWEDEGIQLADQLKSEGENFIKTLGIAVRSNAEPTLKQQLAEDWNALKHNLFMETIN